MSYPLELSFFHTGIVSRGKKIAAPYDAASGVKEPLAALLMSLVTKSKKTLKLGTYSQIGITTILLLVLLLPFSGRFST